MKGVILAAGVGSRLRPLTLRKPKTCATVDGTPILAHQLHAYADAGVTDVVVVAGYLADDVRRLCEVVAAERPDLDVTVRESEVYANTDNMYSLYLARETVAGDPFVLSNGDVVFEPELLVDLLEADADSAIATDAGTYSEEAMKVTVGDGGRVTHVDKAIPEDVAWGVSADVYRFSPDFSELLFDEVIRTIEREDDFDDWTEAAIDRLVRRWDHDVTPVDVSDRRWVEVDDFADLRTADLRFSSLSDLASKEAVFFDLDGTVYLDDELVPGVDETVGTLREQGVDVYFLTNNSSKWKDDYAERLTALGVSADPEDVLLSTDGVIQHLGRADAETVYVLGTTAMRAAIADHGIGVIEDCDSDVIEDCDSDVIEDYDSNVVDGKRASEATPDAVVVGFDTELTYEKARQATLAVRDGATFLLAHPDPVCPTAEGFVPDCGAIGAMIERATDRRPDRVFGKPNAGMLAPVLDAEGYASDDVVVVGDRLETDIRLAANVGCESVCVLSGDATRAEVEESDLTPTLVAPDASALTRFVAAGSKGSRPEALDETPAADESVATAERRGGGGADQ